MGIKSSVWKKTRIPASRLPVISAGSKEELAEHIKREKLRIRQEETFWKKVVPKGKKAGKIRGEMVKRLHNLVGLSEESKEKFLVRGFEGALPPQQLSFLARYLLMRAAKSRRG